MRHWKVALAAALVIGFASPASALTYTLNYSLGSDPVSGEIDVTITAAADGSSVTILIDITDLSSPEFLKELYFNITDINALDGTVDDANSTNGLSTVSIGENAFQSYGDGYHDILLAFESAAKKRLKAGDTYQVVLNGVGLTEDMFDDFGTASGMGQFHVVAMVSATGDGSGDDWVGDSRGHTPMPEPSGALLFGLGATMVGARLRRRRG